LAGEPWAWALILSLKPDQSPFDVLEKLILTARDLGPPGLDEFFGVGLVNAHIGLKVTALGLSIFSDGFETGDTSRWSTEEE
jgi:hypothetical protein